MTLIIKEQIQRMYDDAAQAYKEAVEKHNRKDAKLWKARIEWCDMRLAGEGET
jgi:hypothetical protein